MPNKSGTLREPAMLTPKEIYEKVTAHLLTQRAVSEHENCSCRLRSAQGRKCAIGSLVSDGLDKPAFEGAGMALVQIGGLVEVFRIAKDVLSSRQDGIPHSGRSGIFEA